MADVTTENHQSVQSGSSLGGTPRPSTVATASSPRHQVPGQATVVRPVRAEPSWGRVLLTTVELWASRRLSRVRLRPGRLRTVRRWRLQKLALAVVAAAAITLAALELPAAFSRAAPQAVRPSVPKHPAARHVSSPQAPPAQSEAAAWIASQVNSAAVVGCYPAMCASLRARGVSANRLVALGSTRADVIAILSSADQKPVDRYAPALIASFGSGGSRIEIRAVTPGGAASYQSALRADLNARKSAGSQLLRNNRIRFSAADARQLRAGEVDSRLLATLAALSSQFTLQVMGLGDSSPGAPLLFREVTVASYGRGNGAARLAAALAMVKAQEGPYLPARSAIVRLGTGQPVLLIEFASPSPLGLLTTVLTADMR